MKKLLLATLLGVVAAFSFAQGAFAEPVTVAGQLDVLKTITVNPAGVILSTISAVDGTISPSLTPSFIITSNSVTGDLSMGATVNTGVAVDALGFDGSDYYLALANTMTVPTAAAVTSVIGAAAPVATANPNAISYRIALPTATPEGSGVFAPFTWSAPNFVSTGGTADTYTTASAISTLRAGTFSGIDTSGSYQAIITMSFI